MPRVECEGRRTRWQNSLPGPQNCWRAEQGSDLELEQGLSGGRRLRARPRAGSGQRSRARAGPQRRSGAGTLLGPASGGLRGARSGLKTVGGPSRAAISSSSRAAGGPKLRAGPQTAWIAAGAARKRLSPAKLKPFVHRWRVGAACKRLKLGSSARRSGCLGQATRVFQFWAPLARSVPLIHPRHTAKGYFHGVGLLRGRSIVRVADRSPCSPPRPAALH